MYQIVSVDDWKLVDCYEVIKVLSPGCIIYIGEPSEGAVRLEIDEPPPDRKS
jgi:hypothetical protein